MKRPKLFEVQITNKADAGALQTLLETLNGAGYNATTRLSQGVIDVYPEDVADDSDVFEVDAEGTTMERDESGDGDREVPADRRRCESCGNHYPQSFTRCDNCGAANPDS